MHTHGAWSVVVSVGRSFSSRRPFLFTRLLSLHAGIDLLTSCLHVQVCSGPAAAQRKRSLALELFIDPDYYYNWSGQESRDAAEVSGAWLLSTELRRRQCRRVPPAGGTLMRWCPLSWSWSSGGNGSSIGSRPHWGKKRRRRRTTVPCW